LPARLLMDFISGAWAVMKKDILEEYRARYAFNTTLLFCVTCLVMVSYSLGGAVTDPMLQSAMLWVILFFSAMTGLSRAFIKEEDKGTMNTLRLCCRADHVFYGKTAMNFLLMSSVIVIVAPLFIILLNVNMRHVGYFALTTTLATVGLSAVSALLSAIVAQARARGMLFPVLAFPALMPVFLTAVRATGMSLAEAAPWTGGGELVFLAAYAVAATVGGGFLFEYVFSEQ